MFRAGVLLLPAGTSSNVQAYVIFDGVAYFCALSPTARPPVIPST
jgi:hypothetical protein